MADDSDVAGNGGVYVEEEEEKSLKRDYTLCGVIYSLLATVLFPHHTNPAAGKPLLQRIKISSRNLPLLPEASRNSARHLLAWARNGSPLRALLVISVGGVALLGLTGVMIFTLFFVAATANAIIVSLLMSLAAAGGFLAMFFAFVTAIYIGALAVAIFFISTATLCGIVAVVVATGWVGFFLTMWLATKKSYELAKHSISFTGTALTAYTASRHLHRRHHQE